MGFVVVVVVVDLVVKPQVEQSRVFLLPEAKMFLWLQWRTNVSFDNPALNCIGSWSGGGWFMTVHGGVTFVFFLAPPEFVVCEEVELLSDSESLDDDPDDDSDDDNDESILCWA